MSAPGGVRARSRLVGVALAMGVALAVVPGCAREEKVVAVHGIGHNVPGALSPLALEARKNRPPPEPEAEAAAEQALLNSPDASGEAKDPLRVENEDGTIRLVSTMPRHVMYHVRQTLAHEEYDLLYEQVLSERTKQDYRRQGSDPHEAIEYLRKNRDEVYKLFARLPAGSMSAGAFLRPMGGGVYRIQTQDAAERGRKFSYLDVVWEQGVCRLVVIR